MDFATYLGFSEDEVEQELASTSDPITAILKMYKTQGRHPSDFVQAMYETSRKTGVRKAAGAVPDQQDPDCAEATDNVPHRSYRNAEQLKALLKKTAPEQTKNSLKEEGIHMGEDDPFDAATIVLPGWFFDGKKTCVSSNHFNFCTIIDTIAYRVPCMSFQNKRMRKQK